MIYGNKFLNMDSCDNDILSLENMCHVIDNDILFLNNISDDIVNEASIKDSLKEVLNKITNLIAKLIHIIGNFIGKIIPKFKQIAIKLEIKLLQAFSNSDLKNYLTDDNTAYLIWMIKYDKLNKDLLTPYQNIHKRIVENSEKYLSYISSNDVDKVKDIVDEFKLINEDHRKIWDKYSETNEMKEYYEPITYHLNNPQEVKLLKSNTDKNNSICDKIYSISFDYMKEDNKIINKLNTIIGTDNFIEIIKNNKLDTFTILNIVKSDISVTKRLLLLLNTGYRTTLQALIKISKDNDQKEFQDKLEDLDNSFHDDFNTPIKHLSDE